MAARALPRTPTKTEEEKESKRSQEDDGREERQVTRPRNPLTAIPQ
nr:MAG TPA: hypothetical protein [Caudoviricetes sp.]